MCSPDQPDEPSDFTPFKIKSSSIRKDGDVAILVQLKIHVTCDFAARRFVVNDPQLLSQENVSSIHI